MNLMDRFSEQGRERLKEERRQAWARVQDEAPDMVDVLDELKKRFNSTVETLYLGDELVYGEEIDYGRECPLEYCMATSRAQHKERLRELPCVISGKTKGLELHHCHGGSISAAGFRRGMGQKTSDWLLIPIHKEYHTGNYNPEVIGMERWEMLFGPQIDHLRAISEQLGYDVIERARGEEGK